MKAEKRGVYINMSIDALMAGEWGEMFPQKVKETIEHPIDAATVAAYREYGERFATARLAWEKVQAEGERLGWATSDGGYEFDPAELRPLTPRVEHVYEETREEWYARVQKIMMHHQVTGEWLEEPQPTFRDLMMQHVERHYDSIR